MVSVIPNFITLCQLLNSTSSQDRKINLKKKKEYLQNQLTVHLVGSP